MVNRSKSIVALAALGGAALAFLPVTHAAPLIPVQASPAPTNPAPVIPASGAPQSHYQGTVASVSSTGFTMTTQNGSQALTVNTSPDTRFLKSTDIDISTIQTGQSVMVGGKVDDANSTVAARVIHVLPTSQQPPSSNGTNPQTPRHGVMGTVAGTTPSLTVTTPDNKTYTVQTDNNTIIRSIQPASPTDVAAGSLVSVAGSPIGDPAAANPSIDAKRIEIVPALTQSPGANNGAAPNPPPAPAN